MAQKKKTQKKSGYGVDLLDKQKAESKITPPAKYNVVFHNDDYTPMQLVTMAIMYFFHHPLNHAQTITMNVHEKGKGIAGGPYSKEIADTKTNSVIQFFRARDYPLYAEAEKV